jgi:hypothetical protein
VHVLITSTAAKPVALVKEIFIGMLGARRRDVINTCITAGIAANTAKTQYQILKGRLERGELDEEIAAMAEQLTAPVEAEEAVVEGE